MKNLSSRKFFHHGLLSLLLLIAVIGCTKSDSTARVDLKVENLTCGACVAKISDALSELDGVGDVAVSVTRGEARVEFDPATLSPDKIVGRITEAGYPATVEKALSPEEVEALKRDAIELSKEYVGRIGDRLITRDRFAKALSTKPGTSPSDVWREIYSKEISLADAEKNGVVVSDAEVALEIGKMGEGQGTFRQMITSDFGSMEEFSRILREELTIRRHLETGVLQGVTDPAERRAAIDRWYRSIESATPVTIYDPQLRAAVEKGSKGCGGGCCG